MNFNRQKENTDINMTNNTFINMKKNKDRTFGIVIDNNHDTEFYSDCNDFLNETNGFIKSPNRKFYWSYYNSDDALMEIFYKKVIQIGMEPIDEIMQAFVMKRLGQPPILLKEDMENYCDTFIKETIYDK